jgi:hypothetical protein
MPSLMSTITHYNSSPIVFECDVRDLEQIRKGNHGKHCIVLPTVMLCTTKGYGYV